eukprot:gene23347-27992_t
MAQTGCHHPDQRMAGRKFRLIEIGETGNAEARSAGLRCAVARTSHAGHGKRLFDVAGAGHDLLDLPLPGIQRL